MKTYKYDVDVTVQTGSVRTETTFMFDSLSEALHRFNTLHEIRRRSHIEGQYWDVSIYDHEADEMVMYLTSLDFNLA